MSPKTRKLIENSNEDSLSNAEQSWILTSTYDRVFYNHSPYKSRKNKGQFAGSEPESIQKHMLTWEGPLSSEVDNVLNKAKLTREYSSPTRFWIGVPLKAHLNEEEIARTAFAVLDSLSFMKCAYVCIKFCYISTATRTNQTTDGNQLL